MGAFEPVIDVRGLLVAMLVAATLPGQARAATVAIEDGSLRFTASPGERNAVAIDMRPDSRGLYTWWVQDDGAALVTGSGCAPTLEQGRSGARCEAAGVRGVSASLGDGDDGLGWQFITPADVPVPSPYVVDGGSGDDQLSGGRASERLIGGPGRDQLFGGGSFDGGSEDQRYGSGDDYLEGGPGDDLLHIGDGADVASGGEGMDSVDFLFTRLEPLLVTIDGRPDDGLPGGRANVLDDVESVRGSASPDTLIGNEGLNQLIGEGGDDRLVGGGGDDHLIGGNGSDSLDGGAGDDFVNGREERWNPYEGPPGADRLSCGPGTDYVMGDGGGDTLTGDCEQGYDAAGRYFFSPFYDGSPGGAWLPSLPVSPQVQVAMPTVDAGLARVDVPVTCTAPGYCSGSIALTASTARAGRPRAAARAKLGRAGFTVRVGAPQKVRIRLKAAGRNILRGRRAASATAVLRLRDWSNRIVTTEQRVDLRLPRPRHGR